MVYITEEEHLLLERASSAVYDRMPLVMEQDEIYKWLNEDMQMEAFLRKMPPLLERCMEFEHVSLYTLGNSK